MTNYRVFNALRLEASQTGSLKNAWGVMKGSTVASGTIYLDAQVSGLGTPTASYATMSVEFLAQGQPLPCHVRKVEVSAGTVYILA